MLLIFCFSFVSNLLAYITIPKNNGKKITCDKKINYCIYVVENLVYQQIFNSNVAKYFMNYLSLMYWKKPVVTSRFQLEVHTAVHLGVVNRTQLNSNRSIDFNCVQ